MIDPPTPIDSSSSDSPGPPPREPYWTSGTILAWLIILGSLGAHFSARALRPPQPGLPDGGKPDLQLQVAGRQAVGMRYLFPPPKGAATHPSKQIDQQLRQLQRVASRPIDRPRVAVVVAEIRGVEAALEILRSDDVSASPELQQDVESLETIYSAGPEALEPEQRQRLIERHGWFGKLAMSWDLSRDDAQRRAALRPAIRTVIGGILFLIVALLFGVAGLVLCVLGIVLFASGTLRFRYRPPIARNAVFLEAFALYLAWMVGLAVILRAIYGPESVSRFWALVAALAPIACLWPLARGTCFGELREGLGWHRGRGWFREIGIGVLGYVGGLPIVIIGIIITLLLSRFFGIEPTHPISREISADPLRVVALLLLASIYAPLAEETMFRGAFYHGIRWPLGRIASMLLVSFIFAAIHPQGWTAVPALMCIALVFTVLREWRGSIVAPVVAHALNNGVIVTLLVTLAG